MNLWIVTIGSSDIQLDSDRTNQQKGRNEKQRSDRVWSYWYNDALKEQCYDVSFEPKLLYKDKEETYRIAPRILGEVYQSNNQTVQDEIWQYVTFPLLDNFVQKLQELPEPDAIALLLTDQSELFKESYIRQKLKCPYWQDTCTLKPILARYFQEKFSKAKLESIVLAPKSAKSGLDNWDSVLNLVSHELHHLTIDDEKIQVQPNERVYVSHQASTPAISSALQFASLAQFGDRVKFLVSNEYDPTLTGFVESSSYLRGIELQQAQKLLERYDYPGIKQVLQRQIDEAADKRIQHIAYLLDVAIQWNFAEFDNFVEKLKRHPNQEFVITVQKHTHAECWWWAAYEAAYLGVIRLKQGNTVEAMFHSFRAVEGLLRRWVDKFYSEEIKQTKHPRAHENERWDRNLRSYGEDLYLFLSLKKQIDKEHDLDIWVFGNHVFKRRNDLFHQLKGLKDKKAVFESWRSPNEKQWRDAAEERWKDRVLNCLNFVSGQTFNSPLEEATLMDRVHQELERAIEQIQISDV